MAKSGESNFEDGTIPFLSISSIRFGLEIVNSLGMDRISRHTFHLAKYFMQILKLMKYENGNPVGPKRDLETKILDVTSFSSIP